MPKLKLISVKLPEDTYTVIENISKKNNESVSEIIRKLLTNSLNVEWFADNKDILSSLIREQLDIVLKPHIERLAKISAKAGHAALAAGQLYNTP